MNALALKLILTPVLIGAVSLAGRRWGPAVSGWLIGLPLTSGPITFFLALSYGLPFAADSAGGTLAGAIAQALFCLAYAWLAERQPWPVALLLGCLGFGAGTLLLQFVVLPVWFSLITVAGVLLLALKLLPRLPSTPPSAAQPLPRWDLPARMLAATTFVLVLTEAASALGPRLTGLLAPFPLYAATLAVFAHRLQGPDAAIRVMRGQLLGLFAYAGFYGVLSSSLTTAGLAPAFAAALGVALAIQGLSLVALRRRPQ